MSSTQLHTARPNLSRRRFLQRATAALSGLALSGCGWTLADVRTTVKTAADVLYIYTWAGYTDSDLLDRFTQETGIRAIADVFSSNEEMLAKLQAGAGGAYSIIYPSDYMVLKMRDRDLLTELDHSQIVGLDRLYSRFQNPQYDPGDRYSIPVSWGTTGLIYNAKVLNPSPTDWLYLWENQDKIYKRMTLLNDPRETIGAVLRMLGYSYNSKDPKAIERAYQKLEELKPAIASFDSDAWRSQMITGDLKIAMCYSSDANEVIPENEDLRYVLPTSGSSLWMDTLVIPAAAPNPDAAYAWINFMLQPEIAAEICQRLSFATPNEVAFNLLPTEVQNNVTLFPPNPALGNSESLIPLEDNILSIYDRYWTRLTSG
ncbi:MAG: spermidine/putrescine ABC transporter substrate-binding protein [Geitlerinemataceae cyanobacterium]